jgi:hypothetical protein
LKIELLQQKKTKMEEYLIAKDIQTMARYTPYTCKDHKSFKSI